jgi:hypothetical protein
MAAPRTAPAPSAAPTQAGASVLAVVADARAPIAPAERQRAYDAACTITVLALLDALDDHVSPGATGEAVLGFLSGATGPQLAVLLDRIDAREAHLVLVGLCRAGLISPHVTRSAHARIDMRATPGEAAG